MNSDTYSNHQGSQRNAGRKSEPKINEWRGEGIVKARGTNDAEGIKFYPFQTGGGAIHFDVICSSTYTGPGGETKVSTTYVPVNVTTNSKLTENHLRAIRPGMRVRVVGELKPKSYSRNNGENVTRLEVNAFVLEIVSEPAPQPYYGMQQPQPQVQVPQAPYGGYPQQGYVPQGGPAPMGPAQQPYGAAPAYGPYPPAYGYGQQAMPAGYGQQQPYGPAVPGYAAPGAPAGTVPAPQGQQQRQQPAPQQGAAQGGRPMRTQAAPAPAMPDDLPPDNYPGPGGKQLDI